MDFNIEVRKKQLQNLDQVISSSKDRINSVLNYLEWSEDKVRKEDNLVQCSINMGHTLPAKSWDRHAENCLLKTEGYDVKTEQLLSEPVKDSPQTIYLDRNKKIEIITKEMSERGDLRLAWNGMDPDPRTADRMISTFSSDERLAFYNFVVGNTVGPPAPPEFTTFSSKKRDEDKPPSQEELLAQIRDAKRRRIKYRSVHINRKNYTEVIREVIDNQMEEYKEFLEVKDGCGETNEHERPHSAVSRNSAHSSGSSRRRRRDRSEERYRRRSRDRHRSRDRRRRRSRSRSRDRRYRSSRYD